MPLRALDFKNLFCYIMFIKLYKAAYDADKFHIEIITVQGQFVKCLKIKGGISMDIQNLVPVDYSNQRVLLTSQVAEVFNTTPERISHHFSENKQAFDEGEHFFKLTGAALRSFKKKWVSPPFSKMANCLFLWTELGTARHCQMLKDPNALAIMEQLRAAYFNQKPALSPQGFDKVGYIDDKGTAWFNAEFVARGLGFVEVKNGVEYVMWRRVNRYLDEFGFSANVPKGVATSGNGNYQANCPEFLPENIVYRLAMKANNETAVQFQDKMAAELVR